MSSGLRKRLDSYHTCFNEGFYIYTILPLNHKKYPLDTKENRKKAGAMARKLEKELFNILKSSNQLFTTRKYRSEWFKTSKKDITKAFEQVHKKYPNDTLPPISKWKQDFVKPLSKTKEFELEVQDEPLKGMPKDKQKTKSGRVVKSTAKTKFKDYAFISDKKN
jgi:hypothetical protein